MKKNFGVTVETLSEEFWSRNYSELRDLRVSVAKKDSEIARGDAEGAENKVKR